MARIIFYEKPGCGGNARQKALLQKSGHILEVRNLLSPSWTAEELRAFFGARPVAEWFNAASPKVKSGAVKPAELDAETALNLMLADPLLIRRPLMQVGERREVGFDAELIDAWICLKHAPVPVTENCPRHEQGAPHTCASHAEAP